MIRIILPRPVAGYAGTAGRPAKEAAFMSKEHVNCPNLQREAEIELSDGKVTACNLWHEGRPSCQGECVTAPRVRDIMQREVIAIRETASLAELARVLAENRISGVPVIDRKRRLLGVISAYDLARGKARANAFYNETFMVDELLDGYYSHENSRVRDLMTSAVHRVEEVTLVRDVVDIMLREQIHRVIVTRGEELTGIVTTSDMLQVLSRLLS
jgi:CBS domain-containing protein